MRKLAWLVREKTIILILIIGCILRFSGIYPGYPPQHPDEQAYGQAYLFMMNNNLDPGRYEYPNVVPLVQLILFKTVFIPVNWINHYVHHPKDIVRVPKSKELFDRIFTLEILGYQDLNVLYWGRYITAGFGVSVVLLIYLLTKKLVGFVGATSAAFFVAVNFREVLNSHIGLQDIYNAFFLILAMYAIFKLIDSPKRKNYFLAGLTTALYFSTKFQFFSLLPLVLTHCYLAFKSSKQDMFLFIKKFFSVDFIFALILIPGVFILLNPYHILHLDQFKATQIYQASKYGAGIFQISGYSLEYLFLYGLSPSLAVLSIIGVILSLLRKNFMAFLLVLVILQFLYVFAYYSHGGFYTRNFVTIIPVFLIFAGWAIQELYSFLKTRIQKSSMFLCLTVVMVCSWSNIVRSQIIAREYLKPWNIQTLSDWIKNNIPQGSKISTHANDVPIPPDDSKLSYDFNKSFSMDEFREEGDADYAIADFAWTTAGFYWWTVDSGQYFKHYLIKPVDILDYSYEAIAMRELEPSTVFSVFKPWESPDTDFLIAKVPKYTLKTKDEEVIFSFNKGTQGWVKAGKFWASDDNLDWVNGALEVAEKPPKLPGIRWQSPPIPISGWGGYDLDYQIRADSLQDQIKAGYIFICFYSSLEDAKNSKNRVGVRVSSRVQTPNVWLNKELIGNAPMGARYLTVNFSSYDSSNSVSLLKSLNLYKADVIVDYGGVKLTPVNIPVDNIFPNSQSNL